MLTGTKLLEIKYHGLFQNNVRIQIFQVFQGFIVLAVHQNVVRVGYGPIAVDLLTNYYEGQLTDLIKIDAEMEEKEEHEQIIEATGKTKTSFLRVKSCFTSWKF